METRLQEIKEIVERELSCSAHAMEHVIRVYDLCLHLAKDEPDIDMEVLEAATLLHDIARVKEFADENGTIDHAALGAETAEQILKMLGYSEKKIADIKHCIITHRFRCKAKPETREARILFDADKLDVLGATGVARSFIVADQYGQRTRSDVSIDQYLKDNVVGERADGRIKDISRHTPNLEFELKFKHIPERLHTQKAKEIAEKRLQFMKEFFQRLESEAKGEA